MKRSIVIAEDHPFTADGMKAALESMQELTVLGVAANGIEAISMIKRMKPDCALLDLGMPGANGLEVYLEGKRWSPETKFSVITGLTASSIIKKLFEAGIDGLFFKNSSPKSIQSGILAVANGQRVISPEALALIQEVSYEEHLSKREVEVLQRLARGENNRQIAESLGVSPRTVDSHRTNLLRKMNVNTTASLLVTAMRNGLIDL